MVDGKYQSQNEKPSATCETCFVGKSFTTATTACKVCEAGTYQNQNTATNAVCVKCKVGFASSVTEASTCSSWTRRTRRTKRNQ